MANTLSLPVRDPAAPPLLLDGARIRSGASLAVHEVRPGQFQVEGSSHPYYVSVEPDLLCCCHDQAYAPMGALCKHICAVLLVVGDDDVLTALRGVAGSVVQRRALSGRALGVDLAWSEAMQRILSPKGQRDVRATSRVLTDPRLTKEEALRLLQVNASVHVINTLTRIPRLLQDREVRAAIAENAQHISTVARLLPYSEVADFRPLFRGLMSAGHLALAVDVLQRSPPVLVSSLSRQDLLPLFQATDPELRTAAMGALGRVLSVESLRGEGPLPELEAGAPIISLPEPPETRRSRGRRRY
jgi:hypothetical protein